MTLSWEGHEGYEYNVTYQDEDENQHGTETTECTLTIDSLSTGHNYVFMVKSKKFNEMSVKTQVETATGE